MFLFHLLVVRDPHAESSRILVEPHLIDAGLVELRCLFSVGLVILLLLLISSWILFDIYCLKRASSGSSEGFWTGLAGGGSG